MPATVSVHRERIPAECSRTIAEETRMLAQKTMPNFLSSTRWMSSIRRELSTTPGRQKAQDSTESVTRGSGAMLQKEKKRSSAGSSI